MKCQYWRNSENCCRIGGSPIRACDPALPLMEGLGIGGPENPQDCTTLQNYRDDVSQNYGQQIPAIPRRERPYFVK
ncbi:MAG: hypothetical protein HYT72_00055 [Candidatus Aenigmarchaeota archaeon]|nr:hypothetical protein [Candidatus Aenigmarchaeota archaeon]